MMTRRQFLKQGAEGALGATVVLLLTPIASSGCGSSSSSTYGSSAVTSACDGIASTSTIAVGHAHELCVPAADLTSPPAAGASYTTSLTSGHAHAVNLTTDDLRTLNGGSSVTTTTTSVEGHSHGFSIRRA